MNILHLGKYYWPNFGGMEIALQMLAERSAAMGYDVTCTVAEERRDLPREERLNQVTVRRLPSYGKVLSVPLSPGFLWERMRHKDVIHVHLPHPFAELRLLYLIFKTRNPKLRLIPFLHAFPVNHGVLGKVWFRCITRHILNAAECILVSNTRFVDSAPFLKPWKPKMREIPFITSPWTMERMEKVREQKPQERVLFAIGRLVPYKGYDILIRAWHLFRRRHPDLDDVKLVIAGKGPLQEELESLLQGLNLGSDVRLLGEVTEAEKEDWFRKASLFAAPSINEAETFGISILEAMGRGLPVITSDLQTGVAHLARGGDCGAVVPRGQIEALTDAIEKLLLDRKLCLEVGRNNLAFVHEYHTETRLRQAYADIIEAKAVQA